MPGFWENLIALAARSDAGSSRINRTLDANVDELWGERRDRGGHQTQATAALVTEVFGALAGMVGSFYSARSAQNQAKADAQDLEHAQEMAAINARQAELDAQAILAAGRDESAQATLEYGQAKAAERARQGASGFVAGQGSGAEVLASIEVAKRIDAATISRNAVRAAGQRRLQATDLRNQGSLAGVSAQNLRRTARTIRPELAGVASLLNSSGPAIGRYAALRSGRFR